MDQFDEYFRQLGLNISYYRRKKGLTQLQLAEMVGISRTHMSNIEAPNMNTPFSIITLFRIAQALDVQLCALFDFDK